MSELDDIMVVIMRDLGTLTTEMIKSGKKLDGVAGARQMRMRKEQIKDLMLKLIGKYETRNPFKTKPIEALTRDEFRAELRKKVEEL